MTAGSSASFSPFCPNDWHQVSEKRRLPTFQVHLELTTPLSSTTTIALVRSWPCSLLWFSSYDVVDIDINLFSSYGTNEAIDPRQPIQNPHRRRLIDFAPLRAFAQEPHPYITKALIHNERPSQQQQQQQQQ